MLGMPRLVREWRKVSTLPCLRTSKPYSTHANRNTRLVHVDGRSSPDKETNLEYGELYRQHLTTVQKTMYQHVSIHEPIDPITTLAKVYICLSCLLKPSRVQETSTPIAGQNKVRSSNKPVYLAEETEACGQAKYGISQLYSVFLSLSFLHQTNPMPAGLLLA